MPHKKRLLFFDIDGTLAMPGENPGADTVRAIRAARTNGYPVFLSTGRTEDTVPPAVRDIGFDGGIYSAGGRVVADGTVLAERTMPLEMSGAIIQAMQSEHLTFTVETATGNFRYGVIPAAAANQSGANSEFLRVLKIPDMIPLEEYRGEPAYKISFMAESQATIDGLARRLPTAVKLVQFGNLTSGFPVIVGEISDRRIHKGLALEELCAHYGASAADSIAFGDSMNDVEMLLAAGIGIAMGNAEEAVKALADQVCESCREDGVAKALIRLGMVY